VYLLTPSKPTHEGSIVQLGWNAGAHHLKVWGLAKSWNKKVDRETMVEHDKDATALLTVCWSLEKLIFPVMLWRNVSSTVGFRIQQHGMLVKVCGSVGIATKTF
jgi:hypothetical protein